MKMLVTGANGMLGQDLCPYFEKKGYEILRTDYDTLDICNEEMTKKVISNYKPDIIIHCAAYTNVDKAEDDIENAHKINVIGVKNVAKIAKEINAAMVYISTDYVFDGTKNSPYLPDDKPNPINVYGKTKYEGELEVQKYCEKFYIARTSWLYGHKGRNFVETMISLKDKDELKVVNDQKGCPTWTMELIYGIEKILKMPYGIYHVCGSNSATWYEFALEIFKQSDLKVNLVPCLTDDFPRKAKRPFYSVMKNSKELNLTRDWKIALSDYLKLRGDN